MKWINWLRWGLIVAVLNVMVATVLLGCAVDMCPTEEEKATASANGTELVEAEDCLGKEQEKLGQRGHGGDGVMPRLNANGEVCCGSAIILP